MLATRTVIFMFIDRTPIVSKSVADKQLRRAM
jgi:hypothetical protein